MDIKIISITPIYQNFFTDTDDDRIYTATLQEIEVQYEIRDNGDIIQGLYNIEKDSIEKENLTLSYLKQKIKETLIRIIQEL